MMIIDSQIHPYAPNTPDRPWQKPNSPGRPLSVTGDEMLAGMGKLGIDGAILVSTNKLYGYDPSYVVEVQRKHPDRFGIVNRINFKDPAVGDTIAEWKKVPGAVAVRVGMQRRDNIAVDDPGLDRALRAAARHDMPVNILFWGNVDAGTAVIDRHPETRFVVDHLAMLQPRHPPTPPNVWADLPKVVELARRPNAVIKVSGACAMSYKPFPYPDIWDQLARVFDAWGFERCLWGTDWTAHSGVLTWEQAVKPFLLTDRLNDSERAMLMGGACAKAYGWAPKKG